MAGQVDIILGGPGSGKTEQANRLEMNRRYVHLSTGALLRTSSDPEVRKALSEGELAPSDDVEQLLLNGLKGVQADLPILLDGFPRTKDEAKWLDDVLPELGRQMGRAIWLNLPQAESQARLAKRGRGDDTAAAEAKRWAEFEHKTKPVLDYYGHRKQLLEINGVGTPQEVADRILAAL